MNLGNHPSAAAPAAAALLALLVARAPAQTIPVPPVGGLGQSQSLFFDDGLPVTSWKVMNPTGAGDSFAIDLDQAAAGMTVTGIALQTWQAWPAAPSGLRYVMLAPDNPIDSLGRTPDLTAPLSLLGSLNGTVTITGNPGVAAGFCPGFVGYDLPDVAIPSGGMHAVASFLTGDTVTWLCVDGGTTTGRSSFSTNWYTTPGSVLASDMMVRVIGGVATGPDSAWFTVDNATGTVELSQTELVTATLWSNCAIQPTLYVQGVVVAGGPFVPVPPTFLVTGYENGVPIADQTQGSVQDSLSDPSVGPCVAAGQSFDVFAFYLDACDLKRNGRPKLKRTNVVTVEVTADLRACNPCLCFGQQDDGVVDSNLWKVHNPAQSRDYFNVSLGSLFGAGGLPCPVSTVTQIEIASWDFCGTGPSWASVGLYESNTASGMPDLANPIALATTLSMAPGAADYGYPATTYDFPDLHVSTSAALAAMVNGHVVAGWAVGDTCIWIAGDGDGIDDRLLPSDTCSTTMPSTTSFQTIDGYGRGTFPSSRDHWIMKLDWQ